jgi:hypothetical protein
VTIGDPWKMSRAVEVVLCSAPDLDRSPTAPPGAAGFEPLHLRIGSLRPAIEGFLGRHAKDSGRKQAGAGMRIRALRCRRTMPLKTPPLDRCRLFPRVHLVIFRYLRHWCSYAWLERALIKRRYQFGLCLGRLARLWWFRTFRRSIEEAQLCDPRSLRLLASF